MSKARGVVVLLAAAVWGAVVANRLEKSRVLLDVIRRHRS